MLNGSDDSRIPVMVMSRDFLETMCLVESWCCAGLRARARAWYPELPLIEV